MFPKDYAEEILEEIVFQRMKLNEEEMNIYTEQDYPFDFDVTKMELENLISRIYKVIDDYYENEY